MGAATGLPGKTQTQRQLPQPGPEMQQIGCRTETGTDPVIMSAAYPFTDIGEQAGAAEVELDGRVAYEPE